MKQLTNPKTENYFALKEYILSPNLPWFYMKSTTYDTDSPTDINIRDYVREGDYCDVPYYSHAIVKPPGNPNLFPTLNSPYAELCGKVVSEISDVNNLNINCILRLNANLSFPSFSIPTQPHTDHPFPHNNLLIYLTDADGQTVAGDYQHFPKEDDVIVFNGIHYHYLPTKGRRVVIVVTYI